MAKTLELRQRHTKFENTPTPWSPTARNPRRSARPTGHHLWVAKAAGYGDNWEALAANGLATPFEVQQIRRNESVLTRIRARYT